MAAVTSAPSARHRAGLRIQRQRPGRDRDHQGATARHHGHRPGSGYITVWDKAPTTTTDPAGIASMDAAAGATVSVGIQGEMDGFTGLTPGANVYPSARDRRHRHREALGRLNESAPFRRPGFGTASSRGCEMAYGLIDTTFSTSRRTSTPPISAALKPVSGIAFPISPGGLTGLGRRQLRASTRLWPACLAPPTTSVTATGGVVGSMKAEWKSEYTDHPAAVRRNHRDVVAIDELEIGLGFTEDGLNEIAPADFQLQVDAMVGGPGDGGAAGDPQPPLLRTAEVPMARGDLSDLARIRRQRHRRQRFPAPTRTAPRCPGQLHALLPGHDRQPRRRHEDGPERTQEVVARRRTT